MKREEMVEIMVAEGNQHVFTYNAHECAIRRGRDGHWCGYVVINGNDHIENIDCHGGVTYDGECKWETTAGTRCIGFDCNQIGDLSPMLLALGIEQDGEYRTKEFAINECKHIVDQLNKKEAI